MWGRTEGRIVGLKGGQGSDMRCQDIRGLQGKGKGIIKTFHFANLLNAIHLISMFSKEVIAVWVASSTFIHLLPFSSTFFSQPSTFLQLPPQYSTCFLSSFTLLHLLPPSFTFLHKPQQAFTFFHLPPQASTSLPPSFTSSSTSLHLPPHLSLSLHLSNQQVRLWD